MVPIERERSHERRSRNGIARRREVRAALVLVHRRCSSQVLGEDSIIILYQAFVLRGYRPGSLHQSIVEDYLLDLRLKDKDRRAQAAGVGDRRDEIAALPRLDFVVAYPAGLA